MINDYAKQIAKLFDHIDFDIDLDVEVRGRKPTSASSNFLTNKEQGDWAEKIVLAAINQSVEDYVALPYGRDDSLSAGDDGFEEFFHEYQRELNSLGKRPDVLVFRREDVTAAQVDDPRSIDEQTVCKAVAALEVRSSSFLAGRYAHFMETRTREAQESSLKLRDAIVNTDLAEELAQKHPQLLKMLQTATADTFRELDFNLRSWSSSERLRRLSALLKDLKQQIKQLQKRDHLSITPKMEDLALVNRWIQKFGVKHFYLQVFFDKAFIVPFRGILELLANPHAEGDVFTIERDVGNQGKTTFKINVAVGREVLGRVEMPDHESRMKELDRGRLLFYVTFVGGRGYLDVDVFRKEVLGE